MHHIDFLLSRDAISRDGNLLSRESLFKRVLDFKYKDQSRWVRYNMRFTERPSSCSLFHQIRKKVG